MRKILSAFILWRTLLFVPLVSSYFFIPIRKGFEYTTLAHYLNIHSILNNFLLYPWANFDGVYYLTIAHAGYTVDNSGFFPLYPILVNIFSLNSSVFSTPQFFVGLILSSVFLFLGLFYFYKLLNLDYKKNISFESLLFLLLFPTSFYFAAVYPESLFFFLTVSSFYFARKGEWLISGICALLLCATRIVGIAIFPALLFEFYIQNKTLFSKKIIPVLLSPIGLVSYFFYDYLNFGNFLQFAKAQESLHNNRAQNLILFPQTIYRYFKIFSTLRVSEFEWWIALLELFSFIFACVVLYVAWKKKVRVSYILFSVFALFIPASTGTFTGMPRYILILFPMFIALALIKNKLIKIAYVVISIILLIILFMLFSKGYYIS